MIPYLHNDTEILINFSGGKDSTAMLLYICETLPQYKKHIVYADTGWEHLDTWEWCQQLVRQARARYRLTTAELEIHRVASSTKDFISMVRQREMFPSPKYRQCTSDLKRGPIQTWLRNNIKSPHIISAMGLRSEESAARAKKAQVSINKTLTNSKREVIDWLPIQDWPEEEVRRYVYSAGFGLHPVYNYLNRFSCRVCIFNNARELAAIEVNDPSSINLISEIEEEIGFTMNPNGSVRELIDEYNQGENVAYGSG
ncbi:MAG: phosphoadenosine phosphosulfate reductase family protein [Deltaproteobacteria bacterium]|nr:phosphoadenosine phosphosulfate reductase family protein [Deltaproteobacteria bacterium]